MALKNFLSKKRGGNATREELYKLTHLVTCAG